MILEESNDSLVNFHLNRFRWGACNKLRPAFKILPFRLAVGHLALDQATGVRFPEGHPKYALVTQRQSTVLLIPESRFQNSPGAPKQKYIINYA